MDRYKKFGIPDNFEELLPDLKVKTLKWETFCYSGTEINNSAKISYYATNVAKQYGNIILSPGLATNTDVDPLMKMLTFWSLTHHYNVITFNTFLGDFQEKPSFESAQKNTYPEFTALLESCIKFTKQYFTKQQNIVVGHSAGATGVIDALNNIVEKNEKTSVSSVMLFAPWSCLEWHKSFEETIYKRCESNGFDNPHKILPVTNIFDTWTSGKCRYISVLPKFFEEMYNTPFRPDLMNKWNTYVTIVAGEKDRKSPPQQIQKKFEELKKQDNADLFKFIVLPNAKHSFLKIYENNQSVISLIKSQRKKTRD
jgi:pimeloyl-ACP methyl ester carboxylesterase